jgi:low affinity Fe/Cu permease
VVHALRQAHRDADRPSRHVPRCCQRHRRLGHHRPLFGFSDTWQLVINTGTTIVTFLMVFLIQSTQNRDAEAIQVKLDELIRAVGHARNELMDLEELEEEDLDELRKTYLEMAAKARGEMLKKRTRPRGLANEHQTRDT